MSKAYPSNLTRSQYEMLSDRIPEPKVGGRPRSVDRWEVLNAIFYVLVEGVRWRALPGDFPPRQTVYTYFRNWRKDGTWNTMHDSLREWVRIEQGRVPIPPKPALTLKASKPPPECMRRWATMRASRSTDASALRW
jgi:putative transposase